MTSVGPVGEEWQKILSDVISPFEENLDSGVFNSIKTAYLRVYTICYQLCTASDDNCSYIYDRCVERIQYYLKNHVVQSLRSFSDEALLEEFVRRRQNHTLMMRWYTSMFSYLSKFITKSHQDTLQVVGANSYRDLVFLGLQGEVAHSVLKLVDKRRNGMTINTDVLKGAIDIFHEVKIYEDILEASIIRHSKQDFRSKASSWIATDSTPEYLLKVDHQIDEVRSSVRLFLPASTEPKMLNALNSEVLLPYTKILAEKESGCLYLLQHDRLEDLSRMHRLFVKVQSDVILTETFQMFLTCLVAAEVTAYNKEREHADVDGGSSSGAVGGGSSSAGGGAGTGGDAKDIAKDNKEKETQAGLKLVSALIELLKKYSQVVADAFKSAAPFQKALKDSFSVALRANNNVQAILTSLVNFCDTSLRKQQGVSDENQSETQLALAVSLLGFMDDKDYFMEVYRTQLSKRLLSGKTTSDDLERFVIGKLKISLGTDLTRKVEGMLNDISLAAQTSKDFETYIIDNPEKGRGVLQVSSTGNSTAGLVELKVSTLTQGHWPSMLTFQDLQLPPNMQICCEIYNEFAAFKRSSQKITWVLSQGTVVVKGTFAPNKVYEIEMAPLQAIVLSAFNSDGSSSSGSGTMSFNDLVDQTRIPEESLKKVLHSLHSMKHKILKKISNDVFIPNDKFSSPVRKFKIPMAALTERNESKIVDESRKVIIEAAVVRIMKARKTLCHQPLVSEVLSQLSAFKPEPKMVKKSIESLIDREYLERDSDAQNSYKYLA